MSLKFLECSKCQSRHILSLKISTQSLLELLRIAMVFLAIRATLVCLRFRIPNFPSDLSSVVLFQVMEWARATTIATSEPKKKFLAF